MKFSSKIQACGLSPVRKFYPYEVAATAAGVKVYHLNIGQPDVETPEVFLNAIRNYTDPVVPYAPAPGVPAFLESVRKYYGRLGCQISTGDIMATYGGSEALQVAMTCILDDGDEILVPEPFYPNYNTFIRCAGGKIRPIPTTAEEGYRFASRERIEPLINEHTRAILITNPGNPTGVVLTDEECRLLADIAKEHDLFLISDEVYREIVYGGREVSSMLRYEDAAENVVIIDSVSKRFSATGARVGMILSRNRELLQQATKISQSRLGIGTLDQLGAAAMYEQLDEQYYTAVQKEYGHRREAVIQGLSKLKGVQFRMPEGAFYLMVTLPVDDAEKLQYFLLEEFRDNNETVMVTPAESFYATPGMGRNEIRIAYVTRPEDIARSIELLGLGVEAYNKKRLG